MSKPSMTYGTSHFVDMPSAIRYYKAQGDDAASVRSKLDEGSIHLGKPVLKPGQRLHLLDEGTRYAIIEEDISI